MKAQLPDRDISLPLGANVLHNQKNPIQSLLNPLLELAENSHYLIAGSAGEFSAGDGIYQIPRFIFMGPTGGGETIRLAIFAGIHGNQPEGSETLVAFLQALESRPWLGTGYHIFVYPVCNPTGFAAQTRNNSAGEDLAGHFWRGSSQPETHYLEREIGVHRFHGVISLGTRNDSEQFVINVNNSPVLNRALAAPAVLATDRFLSGTSRTAPDSANALPSSVSDFLTADAELEPVPFELHFGIPGKVPKPSQIHGTVAALGSIFDSYRSFISFGQNL